MEQGTGAHALKQQLVAAFIALMAENGIVQHFGAESGGGQHTGAHYESIYEYDHT